jgi:uracil-DNA glycosylase
MPINIVDEISHVKTDWKNILLSIANKHAVTIDEKLSMDEELFQDVLEIVPPKNMIFNAFNLFDVKDLKVCIIGMDPYIKKGEAMGLSFSVPQGTKCPPSLRNIFKELTHEYSVIRTNTDLTDWASQGVLLLNTALTTLESKTGYHVTIWKKFVEEVLDYITKNCNNIVYILWGSHAQQFQSMIDSEQNLILTHSHPSPLSRKPFVGNNHFRLCNSYLKKVGKQEIQWIP